MPTPNTSLRGNTSLRRIYELQALDRMAELGAMTAAAAAKNNSLVAARTGFLQQVEQLGKMWVIEGFENLKEPVGSGECPGIVQSFGGLPSTSTWFAGPKVRGNPYIPYGTALATFVNGKYPNQKSGNHVAIYISQDPANGILVFDQWHGQKPHYRYMQFLDNDGLTNPSNNGSAFSIILSPKDSTSGSR